MKPGDLWLQLEAYLALKKAIGFSLDEVDFAKMLADSRLIATFGDDKSALMLYDLALPAGLFVGTASTSRIHSARRATLKIGERDSRSSSDVEIYAKDNR